MPCPPPGDLPNPGIEPRSPALQADSLSSEPPGKPILKANPSLFFQFLLFPLLCSILGNLFIYLICFLLKRTISSTFCHLSLFGYTYPFLFLLPSFSSSPHTYTQRDMCVYMYTLMYVFISVHIYMLFIYTHTHIYR